MDQALRSKLIRLAFTNPRLRPKLLPMLKKARWTVADAQRAFKKILDQKPISGMSRKRFLADLLKYVEQDMILNIFAMGSNYEQLYHDVFGGPLAAYKRGTDMEDDPEWDDLSSDLASLVRAKIKRGQWPVVEEGPGEKHLDFFYLKGLLQNFMETLDKYEAGKMSNDDVLKRIRVHLSNISRAMPKL